MDLVTMVLLAVSGPLLVLFIRGLAWMACGSSELHDDAAVAAVIAALGLEIIGIVAICCMLFAPGAW